MTPSRRRGLSLTEVLVALAIGVLAIGLLLPANSRRGASARAQCSNNVKQVMIAIIYCNSTHNASLTRGTNADLFPPGCIGPGETPDDRLSWMVAVLPYLDREEEFRKFDISRGYAGNLPATQATVKTFLCPQNGLPANTQITHYLAMAGVGLDAASRPTGAAGNGFLGYDRPTSFLDITDGTSNTIAVIETRSGLGPWARGGTSNLRGFDPADLPLHGNDRPFGGHPTVMLAGMADGAVLPLSRTIDPAHLAARITIAGGEVVE